MLRARPSRQPEGPLSTPFLLARGHAVALALLWATACGGGDITSVSQSPPPAERSVAVVAVEARPLERTLALPAELVAFQDVAIHARVESFVESIAVDRGSVVRRGATLARLAAPELEAERQAAEAEVRGAEATLAEAQAASTASRSTYERLQRASATPGVVAGNDLEIARQTSEAARARVDAATTAVDARRQAGSAVRHVADYLHVTAPFDGVVTERLAHVGSLVGPASPAIVRMQQVSPLRLVVPVPEAHVAAAGTGQPIEFSVTAFPAERLAGTISRIARAVEPRTRTMAVEIDVANRDGRLAPGMFADVRWPVRRTGPSLFVPRTAVVTTTERTFVVRVKDGAADWVDVRRGAPMGDAIEVLGDLAAGDEVAIRATDEIRPGTRVRASRPSGG